MFNNRAARHIRRNAVAWLALFVALGGSAYAANTIGSADVINESLISEDLKNYGVKRADIGLNSINGARIEDDSLGGADILESSLGKVGDADTVDGLDSTSYRASKVPAGAPLFVDAQQSNIHPDLCAVAAEWRECGQIVVHVRANKIYRVIIDSAGSYHSAIANG